MHLTYLLSWSGKTEAFENYCVECRVIKPQSQDLAYVAYVASASVTLAPVPPPLAMIQLWLVQEILFLLGLQLLEKQYLGIYQPSGISHIIACLPNERQPSHHQNQNQNPKYLLPETYLVKCHQVIADWLTWMIAKPWIPPEGEIHWSTW